MSVVRPSYTFHIFDFSSETTERNSKKLDRKLDLNVLYKVCVFRADRKNKMAARPMMSWDIFDFSSGTAEWNLMFKTWQDASIQCPLPILRFLANRKTKITTLAKLSRKVLHFTQVHATGMWPFGPLVFITSLVQWAWISTSLCREAIIHIFYKVCLFQAYPATKMADTFANLLCKWSI